MGELLPLVDHRSRQGRTFVSVAAAQLTEPAADVKASELRSLVQDAYAHLKYQSRKDKQDEIVAFVTQMTVGDVVVTTHEHAIVVGDVISGWSWTPSSDGTTNLRRSVEWRNPDTPIDFSDLPAPLPRTYKRAGRSSISPTTWTSLTR